MVPDEPLPGVAELIIATHARSDVDLVLDRVDCREAARGLAWLMAQLVELSGQSPAEFLAALKNAIISEHLRRAVK